MRQVVNQGNGTIAVQEIAKIDQNAQKSAQAENPVHVISRKVLNL